MKRFLQVLISLLVACTVFVFLDYMLYFDSQTSLALLFSTIGIDPFSGSLIPQAILAAVSVVVFLAVLQIATNRICLPFFSAGLAVYFVALLAVLFLKSQGIQELNLDLGDIVQQAIFYPSSVLLNVILLIPLGAWLFTVQKSTVKAFFIALGFCLITEAIQYAFSLGIADIVDVLLNMVGFTVGYLSCDLCAECGVALLPKGRAAWKHFERKRAGVDAYSSDSGFLNRKIAVPVLGLLAVAVVSISLGAAHFEYQEFQNQDLGLDAIDAIDDQTLFSLPEVKQSASESKKALASLRAYKVDSDISNSNWLAVGDDGSFDVEGYVTNYEQWLDENGATRTGITVSVPETCGGLQVVHALPVVLRNPSIKVQGQTFNLANKEELESFEDVYRAGTAKCKFVVQDGWLEAISVSIEKGKEPSDFISDISTDWSMYSDYANEVASGSDYWLEAKNGSTFSLTGELASTVEMQGKTSYARIAVLDRLGSALITHQVKVLYDGEAPETDSVLGLITMDVTFGGGNLKRVE